jgi:TPR repeat protein
MGVGMPRDYRAALRGFEDAAEMGDVTATYSVGYMHLQVGVRWWCKMEKTINRTVRACSLDE